MKVEAEIKAGQSEEYRAESVAMLVEKHPYVQEVEVR